MAATGVVPCEDCAAARVNPDYKVYSPKCLWCGARYWLGVAHSRKPDAWREHIGAVWSKHGHKPARIAEAALAGELYEPPPKAKKEKT
jgi:hypothetical protein